ncbi:DUF1206 domain-containing protein [Neolewinella aurantiaca]|uniref:DUF1206 domain-containing protein n=1 Tax=Neolewinella aurantiaca TaxID=2602767 RepID=A0A5C7FDG1_9BACT|nr:DUF1206 domain-containing protein [Neolewinella aurantiaca]TXF88757.1 DUF1206 domain-containing protein [Neolewinella aurantiaca]
MSLSEANQQRLYRFGYGTKGVVYFLMGAFALATVIGVAYGPGGPEEIMLWLNKSHLGNFLLGILGTGLAAYSVYKVYSGLMDTRNEGINANGIANRLGWFINGIAYGGLSWTAFSLLFGVGLGDDPRKDAIGLVLMWEYGYLLITFVGAIIVGVGLFQMYLAVKGTHMDLLENGRFGHYEGAFYRNLGRFGIITISVVYLIMGYFLYRAAWTVDPEKFKGVGDSLTYLKTFGLRTVLLAVLGLGLLAYSAFMWAMVVYGREVQEKEQGAVAGAQ